MKLLAWDTETHLIQSGLLAPPVVAHSMAWRTSNGEVDSVLHDKSGMIAVESNLNQSDVGTSGK